MTGIPVLVVVLLVEIMAELLKDRIVLVVLLPVIIVPLLNGKTSSSFANAGTEEKPIKPTTATPKTKENKENFIVKKYDVLKLLKDLFVMDKAYY